MTLRLRFGFGLLALALPFLTLAAPANVTGIRAETVEGGVRVSWQPVSGSVAGYRIYFSRASILQNGGLYDDFEEADASVNAATLRNLPPGGELFVSVLAFDATGAESPSFAEEARVAFTATADDRTQLRLLTAEAVSATGVLLTFSLPVEIPAAEAATAIVIEDGSGTLLPLTRLVIQGSTVTVHTAPQTRGLAYRVRIGAIVRSKGPDGTLVPLAADQMPLLFIGHTTGLAPQQTAARGPGVTSGPAPAGEAGDVAGLHLRGEPARTEPVRSGGPEGAGYAVTVRWQPPARLDVTDYSIEQTTDDGRSFAPPFTVPASTNEVRIPGVTPGRFGVRVSVRYGDATVSRGVLQFIDLPGASVPNPVAGNVTEQAKPTARSTAALPNSGPALWMLIGVAGAMAGAWRGRRKGKVMG